MRSLWKGDAMILPRFDVEFLAGMVFGAIVGLSVAAMVFYAF